MHDVCLWTFRSKYALAGNNSISAWSSNKAKNHYRISVQYYSMDTRHWMYLYINKSLNSGVFLGKGLQVASRNWNQEDQALIEQDI
jgi:hypothetical protein